MGFSDISVTMVYTRFVETGRVALTQSTGANNGKLVVILDVIDQQRVLVDGPDAVRGASLLKNLRLTDFSVSIKRNSKTAAVKEAFTKADIATKWAGSKWSQTRERRVRRAALTDFDRFKVMMLKKNRTKIINTAVNKA